MWRITVSLAPVWVLMLLWLWQLNILARWSADTADWSARAGAAELKTWALHGLAGWIGGNTPQTWPKTPGGPAASLVQHLTGWLGPAKAEAVAEKASGQGWPYTDLGIWTARAAMHVFR